MKKHLWKTRIKIPVHSWMWEQKFRLESYPCAPPQKKSPKTKENTTTVIDTDAAKFYSYSTGRIIFY